MKTLVVGLGNPILGDDGVGWRIAQELQNSVDLPSNVDVVFLAIGGISLMEAMEGYGKAILVDAIDTHRSSIGTISIFKLEDMADPFLGHLSSAHDTSLQNALRIGLDLGVSLPNEITVVAIESQKVYDFSEEISPPVKAAIPRAVNLIKKMLTEEDNPNPLGPPPTR